MRNCANCYNGHYNLSDRGEEMYCDEAFIEIPTESNECCESHRFYPGMANEKNYIFYDESYLAPGYLIINMENGKLNKFIKLYNMSQDGFPQFAIRGYQVGLRDDPETEFTEMTFSFRDIEDYQSGLFDIFDKLSFSLSGHLIYSVDQILHARNHLKMTSNDKVVTLSLLRDVYYGDHTNPDYFDIILGDDSTCKYYYDIYMLYQKLANLNVKRLDDNGIKKILFKNN